MRTFGSIFTGGDLAGEGANAAGYETIWGIEIDDKIVDVARANGHPVTTADVLDIDPHTLPVPDLFHASPVCTNASIANRDGEEAADFGVPQSRRRLFVRAVSGGLVPHLPEPIAWRGWYEAVADIVHTFPETKFAKWQLKRLPKEIKTFFMQVQGEGGDGVLFMDEPMQTITANHSAGKYRAYLVGQQKFNDNLNISEIDQPAMTLSANHNQRNIRAFIVSGGQGDMPRRAVVNGTPNDYEKSVTVRDEAEPMFTLTASETRRPSRMWTENGRVVKITPRGLARFQTLRDSYALPESDTLAVKIIGNGIPCLMYQRIAEMF